MWGLLQKGCLVSHPGVHTVCNPFSDRDLPKPFLVSSPVQGLSSMLSAEKDCTSVSANHHLGFWFCLCLFPSKVVFTKTPACLMILSVMLSMHQLMLFPVPKESWCNKCSKLWECASSIWKSWAPNEVSNAGSSMGCQHPGSTGAWEWGQCRQGGVFTSRD